MNEGEKIGMNFIATVTAQKGLKAHLPADSIQR